MLLERDRRPRDEAERIVRVFTTPELENTPPGTLIRADDESDERYARRADALRTLLGGC